MLDDRAPAHHEAACAAVSRLVEEGRLAGTDAQVARRDPTTLVVTTVQGFRVLVTVQPAIG